LETTNDEPGLAKGKKPERIKTEATCQDCRKSQRVVLKDMRRRTYSEKWGKEGGVCASGRQGYVFTAAGRGKAKKRGDRKSSQDRTKERCSSRSNQAPVKVGGGQAREKTRQPRLCCH